jgi:hypothetical protein
MNDNINTEVPTSGYSQPVDPMPGSITANPDGTLKAYTPTTTRSNVPRRGRHPETTPGAFGNGRKHNGIKYRRSSLLRRFR